METDPSQMLCAFGTRLFWCCRHGTALTEHLPSALRCIQEAASGGSASEAAEVAQASLQLALLVDEALQVRSQQRKAECYNHESLLKQRRLLRRCCSWPCWWMRLLQVRSQCRQLAHHAGL